jgi:preprotein translocase subunit SecG
MLSFMRDQGSDSNQDSSKENPSAATGQNGPGEQEYIAIAPAKHQAQKSTVIVAVLFCIGLVCLGVMIKKSSPQTAGAAVNEEAQIELALSKFGGSKSDMFSGVKKVVNRFYELSNIQQVGVGELAKNPFKHEMFLGEMMDGNDFEFDSEMMRRQRLKKEARGLELLSIMQAGSDSERCCMIEDKILYKGDSIKGFKVRQISNNFVRLESEGVEILLRLEE